MDPTGRFTDRANAYVLGRPGYPPAAIDALLAGLGEAGEVVVADLGAGTGISARLLAERGAEVLAIEPNAAMRAKADPHPRVRWIAASAERTGLGEASVDLVTAFQAWHWFEHRAALDEVVRIVRPGGRAAVVYNERDERDPFTTAYGDLVRRFQTDESERRRADALEGFTRFEGWHGGPRRLEWPNDHVLDRAGLAARAGSTSYLPQRGPEGEALYAELERLFEAHARDGRVALVMRTIVVCGDLGADGG